MQTRTVEVSDLVCAEWFEDTGVEFDWQPDPAGERNRENQSDAFFRTGSSGCILELRLMDKSGNTVVQYADQDVFLPTEG